MKAAVGASSDVGRVRGVNEDSFLVDEPLFGVADGMGGHVAGDVASRTAVETITKKLSDGAPDASSLAGLVRAANSAIWEKARGDPSLHGMGTTCTLLLLEDPQAHFAHVGDSRAYLFRDGELSQVTEDHTLVERMVKEGRIRREEADTHPQRSIITRTLGVDSDVQVDTFAVEVKAGDRLLLCSDGLNSMVANDAIRDVLAGESDPQGAADRLVELANEAGGEDNITVLIIDITDADGTAAGAPPSTAARPRAEDASPAVASATPEETFRSAAPASTRREDVDDGVDAPAPSEGKAGPRWGRIVAAVLLVLGILAATGYIAFRYLVLERNYYVGTNPTGMVTIYRGLPGEIAGVDLSEPEQVTDLALAEVPEFLQEGVREGLEADSLAEAQDRVADLEARAEDIEEESEKAESRQRQTDDRDNRKRTSRNNG